MSDSKTMIFKVYGIYGHRIKESFNHSHSFRTFNDQGKQFDISVINADITGTNEYSVIMIRGYKVSKDQIIDMLFSQISDGIFENQRTGRIEGLNSEYF